MSILKIEFGKSFLEFLALSPPTLIMLIFTIPIVFSGYVITEYWYGSSDDIKFNLAFMEAIIVTISLFTLTSSFTKLLPSDRSALPNNKQAKFIFPRIVAVGTIFSLIILEILGLRIFTLSVFPIVSGMVITEQITFWTGAGTIFGIFGIPSLLFYWFILLKHKFVFRKTLFTNKYRP